MTKNAKLSFLLFSGNEDEPEDEEDVEQELLAKRFARRARMNRLIEIYGADEEFSQGRLLDQSEEMQKELRSIRVSCWKYVFCHHQ